MDSLATSISIEPLPNPQDVPTLSVPLAGRYLGLGRDAAYAAARRGDLPVIHFGRRMVVPTAALRTMLGLSDAA